MNIIKHFIIGILLCIPVLIKGQVQELKIDFSYNKQSNLLTLKLYNNTNLEITVLNQSLLNESAGSCIILTEKTNTGQSDLVISLYDFEKGKWIRSKTIAPKGELELYYAFDTIPANNVSKAKVFLSTYSIDKTTDKYIYKRYQKEIFIKQ